MKFKEHPRYSLRETKLLTPKYLKGTTDIQVGTTVRIKDGSYMIPVNQQRAIQYIGRNEDKWRVLEIDGDFPTGESISGNPKNDCIIMNLENSIKYYCSKINIKKV